MTDTTSDAAVSVSRGRLPRYWLMAAIAAACLAIAAVVVIVGGGTGGSHHPRAAARNASAPAGGAGTAGAAHPTVGAGPTSAAAAKQVAAKQGAGASARRNVDEIADPEEANSYPAPASVRHRAAAAPASASEDIVAAGAPSDAEVRRELKQMQAVERQAEATQQRQLRAVPGGNSIGGNGTIPIPTDSPPVVQRVIAGANAIADFPYVFGGGHGSFVDNAYDCSGSVSYALAAGGLLSAPETSGELESWGVSGPGRYITVYAAAGHTYMYVNGIMYNTAGRSGTYASRWQVNGVDNTGYVARHWPGL